MGQYYKPVNIESMQWLYSHDYDNGLKLMEHSWIGNSFTGAVLRLLQPGQPWFGARIVWAGDYGDLKREDLIEQEDVVSAVLAKVLGTEGGNLYDQCIDARQIKPEEWLTEEEQQRIFLCNHTKREFVDFSKCPEGEWGKVNPLPLLTANGNGQGGGDYRGTNEELVGSWCGDALSVELAPLEGYTEIVPAFTER